MPKQSYWEIGQQLPTSAKLPKRTDILIVGAGFMGCWLAYWIGKLHPGREVTIIERSASTMGASSRNAGFLTSGQLSEILNDIQRAGKEEVQQIFLRLRQGVRLVQQEFPDIKIDPCGSIDLDPLDDEKRSLAAELNALADLEVFRPRDVIVGGTELQVLMNCEDAGVNPVHVLQSLRVSSRARYVFNTDVLSFDHSSVEVRDRGTVKFDKCFICTNSCIAELDKDSLVVPGRGQVIVTSAVETSTSRTLGYQNNGYDYYKFVNGRFLVGGGRHLFRAQETTSRFETTQNVREYLVEQATKIIGHSQFSVDYHWSGIMGFPDGEHLFSSPVKALGPNVTAIAGFGGMGVALTPVVAQEVSDSL
ncbi:MAG: NAD(P)/FAD-dependent oxidoreductase [Planctomycetota bacterium]|jgi:glycine/D-amino acid oxidase-like deaminating enzyme